MRDRHRRTGRPAKPSPDEPHTDDETRLRRAAEALALADYEQGRPSKRSWLEMRTMTAVSAALCRVDIGPELTPLADEVRRALVASWRSEGPMPLPEAALDAVRDLLTLAQAQRRLCTRAEYLGAIKSARHELRRERPG